MPCSGCAKRREALMNAWHRLRGFALMSNGSRTVTVEQERERRAAEARTAEHERIKQRQREMSQLAGRR